MSIQNFNNNSSLNAGNSADLFLKILAVEPDPSLGEILCDMFADAGYECKVVQSCSDIIPLMESFHPDLVLIEYFLPTLNGGELCTQVKSDHRFSGVPVILYSAYPQILWSIKDYGCDEFIAKPFDLDNLLFTAEKLIVKGKEKRRFSLLADTLKNRLSYMGKFLGVKGFSAN
ncbi:response regulator [Pedobacter boryungensis]|uniref:Response regulator n=1 Tax=Pedobacter boryungensis TaxID=869962 RepID=A0ABX2D9H4_9SPHI|nr:response regulator [Pedobacter boryungensis]NQX30630.1 response regulator [Pedobacter boryungensis]